MTLIDCCSIWVCCWWAPAQGYGNRALHQLAGQNCSSPTWSVWLCLEFTCKSWPVKLEVMHIRWIHLYFHIAIFKSCSFLFCPWSSLHKTHMIRSGNATIFKYVQYMLCCSAAQHVTCLCTTENNVIKTDCRSAVISVGKVLSMCRCLCCCSQLRYSIMFVIV